MDTVNFRDLSVEEVDTRTLLAHASQQAAQRRYHDFFIADIDAHHYETQSFAEICDYIEDPVMRQQAKYQGYGFNGLTSAAGGYQNLAGRVGRGSRDKMEKAPPTPHRDITLTKRWMDAIGIDVACMFPTPMLTLGLTPRPEVEVALARAYNRWLCDTVLAHEPRIKSTLYLPLNNPDATYKMVQDFAEKPGVIGFTVVSPRYKAIHDNAYMKTWALLEERNLSLVFHGAYAWGGDQSLELCNQFMAVHALGFVWFNVPPPDQLALQRPAGTLPQAEGVLDRKRARMDSVPDAAPRQRVHDAQLGGAVAEAETVRLHARDVLFNSADGDGAQPRGARIDLQDDQRRDPTDVCLRLPALGHGFAEHDL